MDIKVRKAATANFLTLYIELVYNISFVCLLNNNVLFKKNTFQCFVILCQHRTQKHISKLLLFLVCLIWTAIQTKKSIISNKMLVNKETDHAIFVYIANHLGDFLITILKLFRLVASYVIAFLRQTQWGELHSLMYF